MTWWGALGLALSLYGVVVLLEWLYDQIVRSHSRETSALSLVVRVTNQEDRIEQAVRDLERLFSQRQWEDRNFEVILVDDGSNDQTGEILERFTRHQPFFRIAGPGLSSDEVLAQCQYPLVVWLDMTHPSDGQRTLTALIRMLSGFRQS